MLKNGALIVKIAIRVDHNDELARKKRIPRAKNQVNPVDQISIPDHRTYLEQGFNQNILPGFVLWIGKMDAICILPGDHRSPQFGQLPGLDTLWQRRISQNDLPSFKTHRGQANNCRQQFNLDLENQVLYLFRQRAKAIDEFHFNGCQRVFIVQPDRDTLILDQCNSYSSKFEGCDTEYFIYWQIGKRAEIHSRG